MSVLFFVRRSDGFLPVVCGGGSLLNPATFQKDMCKPSNDDLQLLTVKQLKAFHSAMGFKLKNVSTKDKLIAFILKEWDDTVENGMTHTYAFSKYEQISTGSRKLMLYTQDDKGVSYSGAEGTIYPFMVSCGQVIPIEYFDTLVATTPSKHQFESLPLEELRRCIYVLRGFSPEEKVSKKVAVETAMDAWEKRDTKQLSEAAHASGEGSSEEASDESDGIEPDLDDYSSDNHSVDEEAVCEDNAEDFDEKYQVKIVAMRKVCDNDPIYLTYDSRIATFADVKDSLKNVMNTDVSTFTLADINMPDKLYAPYRRIGEFHIAEMFGITESWKPYASPSSYKAGM